MRAILLALLLAGNEPIGIVRGRGSFIFHGHKVWGNATVVDGFAIQALLVPLEIRLQSGESWRLAAGSAGHVKDKRFVLEEGTVQGSAPVVCNGVSIQGGPAQVAAAKNAKLLVLAASDSVTITNAAGAEFRRVSSLPELPGAASEPRVSNRW